MAKIRGTELGQGAKALVCKVKGNGVKTSRNPHYQSHFAAFYLEFIRIIPLFSVTFSRVFWFSKMV